MTWKRYRSITELPPDVWQNCISRGEVALDSRLVRVAERVFPGAEFHYGLRGEETDPSALALWMIEDKTTSTGTPETSGLHFWFDEDRLTREAFLKEVGVLCNTGERRLIFRDFIGPVADEWMDLFQREGFIPKQVLDLCTLVIPDHIHTLEAYASVLNSKHRYRWNQYRSALDRNLYGVETVTDYLPLLDELYPLYVEVSQRSEEYAADPYPKDYFRIVKEEFGDDAVMVVIREKVTGSCLGFMLLLYGQDSCVHQYIGFHRRDDLFLWHNLTIESIGDAICRHVRQVNMGVTHATAKRKFGAENKKVFIFIKNECDEKL